MLKEESKYRSQSMESINDEILSLQIQNNLLTEENDKLRKENDQLIDRWLKKVEQDAKLLNDAIGTHQKLSE